MVAAHGHVGGDGVGIALQSAARQRPVPDVLRFYDGDARLRRPAQLHKVEVGVEIAQSVAAAHLVEQIGPRHGAAAVCDSYPYIGVHRGPGGSRPRWQEEGGRKEQESKLHKLLFHIQLQICVRPPRPCIDTGKPL